MKRRLESSVAWNYYLNIEPVALKAAADCIKMMTGANYEMVEDCAMPLDGAFEMDFEDLVWPGSWPFGSEQRRGKEPFEKLRDAPVL